MRQIDLFIVGTQKSGTTSLLHYLGEHPQIAAQAQQEMSYFVSDQEYARGYEAAYTHYFGHALRTKPDAKALVAKHASLCHRPEALERLWLHNAACKLIIILRNPVDRAFSSYLMEKKKWGEKGTFDEVIPALLKAPDDWRHRAYLEYGIYHRDIAKIIDRFGRQALTVIAFGDLKKNPVAASRQVFSALGVDATFAPKATVHNEGGAARSTAYATLLNEYVLNNKSAVNRFARKFVPPHHAARIGGLLRSINRGRKTESISPEMRSLLVQYYKPHNEKLADLLGQDFSHWDR